MKKRLFALLLVLTVLIGLLPVTASADEPHTHAVSADCSTSEGTQVTFTKWDTNDALPTTGTYYLDTDVTLTSWWTANYSAEITLCLNGHNIISNLGNANDIVEINGNAKITICDCQAEQGSITAGNNNLYGIVNVYGSGEFNLYGGKLTGGVGSEDTTYGTIAGGVSVLYNSAKFNMYGGEISGNSGYHAGGVSVQSGIFNMYGGTITNNAVTGDDDNGGGVLLISGAMNVSGTAKVTGNKKGAADNNLHLSTGKVINISAPLTTGASIGVTTQTAPTSGSPVAVTGANSADYSSFFTSDSSDYEIYNDSNTVKLRVAAPTTYTVTFTGGTGATGTAPTQAATAAGGTFTLPANPFTMSGMTFSGWSDGTNTYSAGDTYTMPARNVTFTAQWTDETAPTMVSAVLSGSDAVFTFSEAIDTTNVSVTYGGAAVSAGLTWSSGNTVLTIAGVGEGAYSITCKDLAGNSATLTGSISDGKAAQTITAANVSATYGDTGKKITVTSTNYGALSYAVKSGTSATVDASGSLTIVSAGDTIITITAAGDASHKPASKDVTVSVAKATVTVAAKNQSICVGDTVPDLSSPVKDTHYTVTGLVGSDELTGTLVMAYEKNGSPASPDNTTTGAYDIVVSGVTAPNSTNYNAIVLTGGTLTISTKPSGGGDTPTSTVTGDAGSVDITVTVSGTTAAVAEITTTDLEKVVNTATASVNVAIDLTGLGQPVDKVTLTGSTLNTIADAANKNGSGISGLEVKLSGGTITLGGKTLNVIQEQAGSGSITIVVDPIKVSDLNAKQKAAVEKLTAPSIIDVYFLAGSKRIEDLNGSKIRITVPYVRTKGAVVVNYMDDTGKLEKLLCDYDAAAKAVSFETTHNSYYVVSRDDDPCVNFTDIDRGRWYHTAIDYALENSLMNGVGGGKFDPKGTLTRAMLCQILYNKEKRPEVTAENKFVDVKAGIWYEKAVTWAAENNIVSGYGGNRFGPNDPITREQLATILWRYDGKPATGGSLAAFTDGGKTSNFAITPMQWAVEKKIVSGKGNGILDPRGKATRAEVAQMLMNYLKK